MKDKEVIDISMKAGEILLCSGAEIYRVEDTIIRICRSYGVDCDAFAMPSGIFVSVIGNDGEIITLVKRIKDRTVNLYKIELVNSFSRSIEKNPENYITAMKNLKNIQNSFRYSFPIRLLAAAITAFVYTVLFNGSWLEGTIAFFIGAIIYIARENVSKIGFFQFFETFVSGMIAAGISLLAFKFLPHVDIYKIIIGSIMILLPGVAITNGIKDALYGDIASSISRLGEAIFIAAAAGTGVGVVLSIGFKWV